jgi:hypothetical protein
VGVALTHFLRIAALVLAIAQRADADVIVLHPRRPRPEPLRIDPALPATTRDYDSIGAALGVGEFWSDRDALRAEFARNGYQQPSNVTRALGFVLTFVFSGSRLELGGAFGIQNVESARSEASLESTFVWADLGHDLWRDRHSAFFGFLGVGVDEVKIGLDTSAPPLLAEQMTGIGGEIDIWRNAGQLHGGIGFEHIFPFEKHQSREWTTGAGLSVSTRVGYRSAFSDGNWGNPDRDFAGGPRLGAQGVFALVTMGAAAAATASAVTRDPALAAMPDPALAAAPVSAATQAAPAAGVRVSATAARSAGALVSGTAARSADASDSADVASAKVLARSEFVTARLREPA